jgi:hypothetical protein
MNHPPISQELRAELESLAEAYCRGDLSESEAVRLNQLLLDHPEAQRFFLSHTHLHAALSWEFSPLEFDTAHAYATTSARSARLGESAVSWWLLLKQRWPWIGRSLYATAVALALLLLSCWIYWPSGFGRRPIFTEPSNSAGFATLSRDFGANWLRSANAIHAGQTMSSGVHVLLAGTVELLFTNGARLLIEGPAEFAIVDALTVRMASGQVVLHAPPTAHGFQIKTTDATLTDLGTEFGVKITPKGQTEVQVFDGKVVAEASRDGRSQSQTLLAGSSVRIDRNSTNVFLTLPFEPRRFLRQLPDPSHWPQTDQVVLNHSQHEQLTIPRAPATVTIDGDLSEWDVSGRFHAACQPPFAEDYTVDGVMMYDDQHLYIGAHVSDPFPMRSTIDPATDAELGWKGGGIQVRICVDPNLPWPLDACNAVLRGGVRNYRTVDRNEDLVHLTLWHCAPRDLNCLEITHGMDFHNQRVNPPGYQGVFRMDPNGVGYTVEYAIPWKLLRADPPLKLAGFSVAMSWTVHWSDEIGRLWRGQLVEITNPRAPQDHRPWSDANLWGKTFFK